MWSPQIGGRRSHKRGGVVRGVPLGVLGGGTKGDRWRRFRRAVQPPACGLSIRLASFGERLVVGRDADRDRRVQIHAPYALRDLPQLLFVLWGQP